MARRAKKTPAEKPEQPSDVTELQQGEGLPPGDHLEHHDVPDGVEREHELTADCWCNPTVVTVPPAEGDSANETSNVPANNEPAPDRKRLFSTGSWDSLTVGDHQHQTPDHVTDCGQCAGHLGLREVTVG